MLRRLSARRAFRKGQALARQGEFAGACRAFDAAVSLGAGHGALAHWALSRNANGDRAGALATILEARRAAPDNPAYGLFEALIRLDADDLSGCEALAQAALHQYPQNQFAWDLMAIVRLRRGEPVPAMDILIEHGGCGNLEVRARLVMELQATMPDLVPATEVASPPSSGEVPDPGCCRAMDFLRSRRAYKRGVRLLQRGQPDQALSQFLAARRLGPSQKSLTFHLGAALFELERFAEARAEFASVPPGDFYQHAAQLYEALCLFRLGQFPEADTKLATLSGRSEIQEYQPYLDYYRGVMAFRRDDRPAALNLFRQALARWDPLLQELIQEVVKSRESGRWPASARAADPGPPETQHRETASMTAGGPTMDPEGQDRRSEGQGRSGDGEKDAARPQETEAKSPEPPSPAPTPEEGGPEPTEGPCDELPAEGLAEAIASADIPTPPEDAGEAEEAVAIPSIPPSVSHRPPRPDSSGIVPVPTPGVWCWELEDGPSERFYLLEDPKTHTCLRMDTRDRFLWRQMDGHTDLSEIAERYYLQFKSFGFDRIANLYRELHRNGFIDPSSSPLPDADPAAPAPGGAGETIRKASEVLAFRETGPIVDDGFFQRIGDWGGSLLGSERAHLAGAVLGLAGLGFFFSRLSSPHPSHEFQILRIGGYHGLTLLAAYLINFLGSLIHELTKAMTLRQYGGRVYRGGGAIRFGLLGAFVDLRDTQRLRRRYRVMVGAAGMVADLFLAGLCGFLAAQQESDLWAMATLVFCLRIFFHTCPLYRSDLYRAVREMARMEHLREASLHFLRPKQWLQLWGKKEWNRRELLLLGFGLWCVLWVTLGAKLAVWLFQTHVWDATLQMVGQSASAPSAVTLDAVITRLTMLVVLVPVVFFLAISGVYVLVSLGRMLWDMSAWQKPAHRMAALVLVSVGMGLIASLVKAPGLQGVVWAIEALGAAALGLAVLSRTYRETESLLGSRVPTTLALGALAVALELVGGLLWDISGSIGLSLTIGGCALGLIAFLSAFGLFLRAVPRPLGWPWLAMAVGLAVQLLAALCAFQERGVLAVVSGRLVPVSSVPLLLGSAWLFTTSALAWWRLVQSSPPQIPPYLYPASPETAVQFANGTSYVLTSLLSHGRWCAGDRFAQVLTRRLDDLARKEGVSMGLREFPEIDVFPPAEEDAPVEGLAAQFSPLVRYGLVGTARVIGLKATERLVQTALTRLPWDERELAVRHLLRDTRWSVVLGPSPAMSYEDRVTLLRSTFLFHRFEEPELHRVASIVRSRAYPAGADIIRQDEIGNEAFVIVRGEVEVIVEDEIGRKRQVAVLRRGDFFGELALLDDAPRSATVRARRDGADVLVIDRIVFEQFVQRSGESRGTLAMTIRAIRAIQKLPLFHEMAPGELANLAPRFRPAYFGADTVIIRQGDVGDCFYVIQEGTAEVSCIDERGDDVIVQTLRPGDYFGEIALLNDVPRTATVRSKEPVTVHVLSKPDFLDMLGRNPFARRLIQGESRRRQEELSQRKGESGS